MSSDESVSQWLGQLRDGDPAAAQKLWERYFQRLVGLARKKLEGSPRRSADEEDVALSAFDSFCRGAAQDRFPQLHDPDNLWRLLVTITARKAYQFRLREGCQKRGGNAVLDEAALAGAADAGSGRWAWSNCSTASRRRSSPPNWPRSTGACWPRSPTPNCGPSPSGSWKATPTKRSPANSIAPCARSSANSR